MIITKPLQNHLHLFQLEGYSISRSLSWWFNHPFTYDLGRKKPLVFTTKAKILLTLACLQLLILLLLGLYSPLFLLFPLFLYLQPLPLLFSSLLLMKPYEIINRQITIKKTRDALVNHPHLTTIAITGSYGKTSTKDFLYHILNPFKPTLKTPHSYNTVFGIAKVVNLELTSQLSYFICEMGAYKRGEIKELTRQVPPQYALLTAIGTQHLERFRNIENTILAKFELIDSVPIQNALLNLDSPHIAQQLLKPQYRKAQTYSLKNPQADFYLSQYTLSPTGTTFTLKTKSQTHQFRTPLFGTSNLQNLTAAISIALILKVPLKIISQATQTLHSPPHRLQIKRINKSTLIDNAYSSNEEGFVQIIKDLNTLPGKKALITPGIVELGQETAPVHQKIGRLAKNTFSTVILVGHSERTKNLEIGLNKKPKISFIKNSTPLQPLINKLSQNHSWILLENDLPDNY